MWGAYAVARVAGPRLPAGGSITYTSGTLRVRPVVGMAMAAAGAGALEVLTRALAVELAPLRVRVNAIRPGATDTPLMRRFHGTGPDDPATNDVVAEFGDTLPLGRVGTAEEAAAAALFLMANTYVTGTVVTVDGGQLLK